jgi:hypothetical protein
VSLAFAVLAFGFWAGLAFGKQWPIDELVEEAKKVLHVFPKSFPDSSE